MFECVFQVVRCCTPSIDALCLVALQLSWCKLEVEVDSHKAITANSSENK